MTAPATTTPAPVRRALPPGAWLLLPAACHVGFSWIGFNPTDDGWMQAVARRLLDGQVPHRDFISLRPVLSALLEVPLVWLGGNHVFWLARLWGWIEVGATSWWWSGCLLPQPPARGLRPMLYAVIFFLNAHVFPVMAWHSLDGLLLATGALVLAQRGTTAAWRGAFALAGCAAMCRQNFVFFIPFLALGLPAWRQWPAVLWSGIVPGAYLAVMAVTGALPDFVHQMLALHGSLADTAVRHYAGVPAFFWGLGLGALTLLGLARLRSAPPGRAAAIVAPLALGLGLHAAHALWSGVGPVTDAAFLTFGLAGMLLVGAVATGRLARPAWFPLAAAIGLAWVTSISVGYNNPALMGGVLLVVVWRLIEPVSGQGGLSTPPGRVAVGLTLAALAFSFREARLEHPYQDRPAAELRWDAGAVMRGAAGLRTNAVTYAVLADLRRLTDRFEARGMPFAILSDYACFWANSPGRNPLLCDWPQNTELGGDPDLARRFIRQLCQLPPGVAIIVQKDVVARAAVGLVPVRATQGYYSVQNWLEQHGRQIGETTCFRLYLPPRLQDGPAAAAQ